MPPGFSVSSSASPFIQNLLVLCFFYLLVNQKLGRGLRFPAFSDLSNPVSNWLLLALPPRLLNLDSASFPLLFTFQTPLTPARMAHLPFSASRVASHFQLCRTPPLEVFLRCRHRCVISFSKPFKKISCFLLHASLDSSLWHKKSPTIQHLQLLSHQLLPSLLGTLFMPSWNF